MLLTSLYTDAAEQVNINMQVIFTQSNRERGVTSTYT